MILDRIVVGAGAGEPGERVARWAQAQFGTCCTVTRVPLDDTRGATAEPTWRAWWGGVFGGGEDPGEDARAHDLAAAAFAAAADLVIAGPLGAAGAERLLRLSPVPVLVVGEDTAPEPVTRVLVAVDESPSAPVVLAWARALRDEMGVSVVPCHVVEPPSYPDLRHAAWRVLAGDDEPLHPEDGARAWLAGLLEEAGLPEAREAAVVMLGDPAEVIAAAARACGAGLVVAGSMTPELGDAGRGRVRRPLLRRAHVPVLLAARAHPAPVPAAAGAAAVHA